MPNILHCISPLYTGSKGFPPTNPLHISVPPLNEIIHASGFTFLLNQSNPSPGSGEPVEPNDSMFFMCSFFVKSIPSFMQ